MQLLDAKSRALVSAGLVKGIDLVFVLAILFDAMVTFFDWFFSPSFRVAYLVVSIGIAGLIMLLWAVLLGYRACVMILEARADINLMPENAARLARMYQPTAISTGEKQKSGRVLAPVPEAKK